MSLFYFFFSVFLTLVDPINGILNTFRIFIDNDPNCTSTKGHQREGKTSTQDAKLHATLFVLVAF